MSLVEQEVEYFNNLYDLYQFLPIPNTSLLCSGY